MTHPLLSARKCQRLLISQAEVIRTLLATTSSSQSLHQLLIPRKLAARCCEGTRETGRAPERVGEPLHSVLQREEDCRSKDQLSTTIVKLKRNLITYHKSTYFILLWNTCVVRCVVFHQM